MIETDTDTRAFFDSDEFAFNVAIQNSNKCLVGIFDQNFDQSLSVNGRRTGLRIMNFDLIQMEISVNQILVFDADTKDEASYTIRAIERGRRTALLILEQLS